MKNYPCSIFCPEKTVHCILTCKRYQEVKEAVIRNRIGVMKKEGRYTEKKISKQDQDLVEKIHTGRI